MKNKDYKKVSKNLEAVQTVMQLTWLPISEAKKDGTNYLLFCPEGIPEAGNSYYDDRPEGMTSKVVVGCYRGREHDTNGYWICDVVYHEYGYYDSVEHYPVKIKPTMFTEIYEP